MKEELTQKKVTAEAAGTRLDRCLRLWFPHLPQGAIEKAARKGHLKVEGQKAIPKMRVQDGQTVSFPSAFSTLSPEPLKKEPKPLSLADKKWLKALILYEDDDIVVLNKPAGIAVQKGTKQTKALDEMLRLYFEPAFTPRLVHRLDKETSGVLILAKTLPLARLLTKAFKEQNVEKTYWAVVCGVPQKKEGVIDLPLTKKQAAIGEKVQVDFKEGLKAQTHYRVVDSLSNCFSWLELKPKTGRMHQLRVHCSQGLKLPILGDGKYGGKEAFPTGRKLLHLHARSLSLTLPNKKKMTFEAPLSESLQETFDEMGFQSV